MWAEVPVHYSEKLSRQDGPPAPKPGDVDRNIRVEHETIRSNNTRITGNQTLMSRDAPANCGGFGPCSCSQKAMPTTLAISNGQK